MRMKPPAMMLPQPCRATRSGALFAVNGLPTALHDAWVLPPMCPMEVVNESPGNYQVVFSYRDDGERQALVERIETVTGLELE